MLSRIIEEIKKQNITPSSWIVGFVGILFVRFLLEALSSPTYTGIISSDTSTLIHYGLYFTAVTLGTGLLFGYLLKDYVLSMKYLLFGLPIIWIAPIIDIVLSKGVGFKMSYLFSTGSSLLRDFFTFFGPTFSYGATIGIRIGILVSILGICYLVWRDERDYKKTILALLGVYTVVFIFFSLPSIVYIICKQTLNISNLNEIVGYFAELIFRSNIVHNTLQEGFDSVPRIRMIELGFNKILSQLLYILSFIMGLFLFWKINKNKFYAVIKNSRVERVMSYQLLLLSGCGFAYINNLSIGISWVDILGLLCLLISWFSLWMHAVHVNDLEDIEIDKISNKNRPLIQGSITEVEMREVGFVWLTTAILGSYISGFYPFFMSLVYILSYYIYSASPLRLRRFPIISNFLISIAGLSTIQSGFFFVSADKRFTTFPILLSMGIITMIVLAINTKDMKDIEGDKKNGIMTIPTLFPKKGPMIVGLLFSLSLLLVPVFLKMYILFVFSIPLSLIGYKYINKKPYSETPLFYVRFIFLFCVIATYTAIFILNSVYNLS